MALCCHGLVRRIGRSTSHWLFVGDVQLFTIGWSSIRGVVLLRKTDDGMRPGRSILIGRIDSADGLVSAKVK